MKGSPSWLRSGLSQALSLTLILAVVLGGSAVLRHWQGDRQGQALREQARPGDIVMLSSRSCLYCDRARDWLDAQAVPHSECFIEHNSACREQFQARGGLGTPTFVVRGQTIVGFDRARILALLSRPTAAPG